mmetsp:Transcript_13168/g.20485  ORF Transcript_13168/g.20485 Transcript_13168/m.20485 type:complete len:92 (-) Transcript_13168:2534-2809(-)
MPQKGEVQQSLELESARAIINNLKEFETIRQLEADLTLDEELDKVLRKTKYNAHKKCLLSQQRYLPKPKSQLFRPKVEIPTALDPYSMNPG